MMKIRSLLSVAAAVFAFAAAAPAPIAAQQGDIVAVASGNPDFETLVRAVQAAGLVSTLQGDGPFTVFAPTDAAFARLPAGALDRLLANPDQLRAVLLNHVVAGRVTAADVQRRSSVTTVGGGTLRVRASGGRVMVGNSTVQAADVGASNGVIHVIDTVLLPAEPMSK